MQNVYLDTYGDILNDILNIPKDNKIEPILEQIVNSSENVVVHKEPIEFEKKKEEKVKKKTSKKSSAKKKDKEEEKIRKIRVRRIK